MPSQRPKPSASRRTATGTRRVRFPLAILCLSAALNGAAFGQTLWGIQGIKNTDIYTINTSTAEATMVYDLPSRGVDENFQGLAHFYDVSGNDTFFLTNLPDSPLDFDTISPTWKPEVYLFESETTTLVTFDISTLPGYNSSWFDRHPLNLPLLDAGAGHHAGSIYLHAEYIDTASFKTENAYPFLLKLDLNAAGNGFTGISKIDANTTGFPTDNNARIGFADQGDIDFDDTGHFLTTGPDYNAGIPVILNRMSFSGEIATIDTLPSTVTTGPDNPGPPHASDAWGFGGIAELEGTWYGTASASDYPDTPGLFTLDETTGDYTFVGTTTLGGPNVNIVDLTSSVPVPEPGTALLLLAFLTGTSLRRQRPR